MEKTMNLEKLLRHNHDLLDRIETEGWRVYYDSSADLFVLHGDIPVRSEYVPVNEEGLMVRSDVSGRICALAIENFESFAAQRSDFRLIRFQLRHPVLARLALFPLLLVVSAKDLFTERYQRTEMIEYVSKEAVFGAAA